MKGGFNIYSQYHLDKSLDKNEKLFREIFYNDDSMIFRRFGVRNEYLIMLVDGMVDDLNVNVNIVRPVEIASRSSSPPQSPDDLTKILSINDIKPASDFSDIFDNLLYGDTVLIMDGFAQAFILSTKGFARRGVEVSENERGVKGPQESFSEAFMQNLSLIRRKLRTPALKFSFIKLGRLSRTNIVICYIDGVAENSLVEEVRNRLSKIDMEGILDSNYLAEVITDAPHSPFRTTGSTERPDVVVSKLLEGRVAIMVDGTPFVLTVPHLFMEYFQSPDDYYNNYWYASLSRMLRYIGFILAISVPAIYTAVLNFHPELLPTTMLISIARARQGVLVPTIAELIFMLTALTILQEAGLRSPPGIGQSLSIVGGLILGQASVDARLVSAPVIIVVAVWAVTNMLLPGLRSPIIACTGFLLVLSGILGLYGYFIGLAIVGVFLSSTYSFGSEYTRFVTPYGKRELRDSLIRVSWKHMKQKPLFGSKN